MVVWLGGVEKGGRGEDESSVQLFSKWRNSSALENSLKNKKKNQKGWETYWLTWKMKSLFQVYCVYPESLYFSAVESLCGWMRVWTARSKSFLQKQRCSWAMGSTRKTEKRLNLNKLHALLGQTKFNNNPKHLHVKTFIISSRVTNTFKSPTPTKEQKNVCVSQCPPSWKKVQCKIVF